MITNKILILLIIRLTLLNISCGLSQDIEKEDYKLYSIILKDAFPFYKSNHFIIIDSTINSQKKFPINQQILNIVNSSNYNNLRDQHFEINKTKYLIKNEFENDFKITLQNTFKLSDSVIINDENDTLIYVKFSKPIINKENQLAIIYFECFKNNLNALGMFFILNYKEDKWNIIFQRLIWFS